MSAAPVMYACLAMYPFEPLRPTWEDLWCAVHERATWTPPTLTWPADVHDTWTDLHCAVTQACGWPVATSLRQLVTVVGAFEPRVDGAAGCRYRTVLVTARDEELQSFPARGATVAVNSDDSLSGWISLLAATGAADGWPGTVVTTSSHLASLRAVRAGDAELASIDPLTWAYVARLDPDLIGALHQVGVGPLVPTLPVIVPRSTSPERVEDLRAAFVGAFADPTTKAARDGLLLDGFCPLGNADYDPLLALATTS